MTLCSKKWEEVVLSYGWAYGEEGDKLKGKELIIATTTGAKAYVEHVLNPKLSNY